MLVWVAVGAGGALGSLARHAVNRAVQHHWPLERFPLATLAVNLSGCAVIGVLAGLIVSGRLPMRQPWREFVFVGILGGFTTFYLAANEPRIISGPRSVSTPGNFENGKTLSLTAT